MKLSKLIDRDIAESVKSQIRTIWTHASTALDGNSLTLRETDFILHTGQPVTGRPIEDHNEVMAYAKAIDRIWSSLDAEFTKETLFALHRLVNPESSDGWRTEPRGTSLITSEGKQEFANCAAPKDIPALMEKWLALLNEKVETKHRSPACETYVKLHLSFNVIHPFSCDNGKLARLLANIPALKGELPPITLIETRRQEYLDLLFAYTSSEGKKISPSDQLVRKGRNFDAFNQFAGDGWTTLEILAKALREQEERGENKGRSATSP